VSSRNERRSGSRERNYQDNRVADPDSFTQIYISQLDRKTGQSDIEREFSKFGEIKSVTMKAIFAFVDYMDHESALKAIGEMNEKEFVNGEFLTVQQSRM